MRSDQVVGVDGTGGFEGGGPEGERLDAGGREEELLRIIDEVEALHEERLRRTVGRRARAAVMVEIDREAMRRFRRAYPGVEPRLYTGPYRNAKEPDRERERGE
jgi:hypothetical protein